MDRFDQALGPCENGCVLDAVYLWSFDWARSRDPMSFAIHHTDPELHLSHA